MNFIWAVHNLHTWLYVVAWNIFTVCLDFIVGLNTKPCDISLWYTAAIKEMSGFDVWIIK